MKGLRVWLGLALAVLLALVPVVLAFAYTQPMQPPSPVMPCSPYWLCGQTDDAVNQAVLPQPTLLPHPGKSQPTPRQTPRPVLEQRRPADAFTAAEQLPLTALRPDAERCYAAHPHHAPPAAVSLPYGG